MGKTHGVCNTVGDYVIPCVCANETLIDKGQQRPSSSGNSLPSVASHCSLSQHSAAFCDVSFALHAYKYRRSVLYFEKYALLYIYIALSPGHSQLFKIATLKSWEWFGD